MQITPTLQIANAFTSFVFGIMDLFNGCARCHRHLVSAGSCAALRRLIVYPGHPSRWSRPCLDSLGRSRPGWRRFYKPKSLIPNGWIWLYWMNPISYTLYGLIVGELGNVDTVMQVGDVRARVYVLSACVQCLWPGCNHF